MSKSEMTIELPYFFDFRLSSYVIESLVTLEKSGPIQVRGIKPSRQILELDGRASFSPLNWERSRSMILADFRIRDQSCRVVFDLSDHQQIERVAYLPDCDLYFKRSLNPADLHLPMGEKLRPLGLVTGQKVNVSTLRVRQLLFQLTRQRAAPFADARTPRYAKEFAVCVGRTRDIAEFELDADHQVEQQVLFQTRTWSPTSVKDVNVEEVNQFRRDLAVALQKEFGSKFVGGIYNEASSSWNLLSSAREAYLTESKSSGIGISTTGLHGSVPWKLFEYFAGAKVVISQRNNTLLRVPLQEGIDCLEFDTVDEAVAQCESVLSDVNKFVDLRMGAAEYYSRALKPSSWALGIVGEIQDFLSL